MSSERLQQLLNFLKKAPNDAFTLYSIAYEYMQMGDLEKAKEHFQQLKNTQSEYLGTYYQLGKTLERLNNRSEAELVYREGIQIAQQQKDYHTLGELQRALQSVTGMDYEDEV